VPYGSSTDGGGGNAIPDIDPSDFARVEVLRGPQGTLYGVSSMGGLLKYVTVDPSTDGTSGSLQVGTESVYNGAELGYNFRGAVNVPLSGAVAVRASGFTRQTPGYIDNPVLGIDGINEQHASGGRIAMLWRPSDVVTVKLGALYQHTAGNGSDDVDVPTVGYPQTAGLGDLQQNYIRGVGGYDRKVQAYSANLTAKLGSMDLTALTGYNINTEAHSFDYTYALGDLTNTFFGVTGTPAVNNVMNSKFAQEIRLVAPIGETFEWLFGVFYTHENAPHTQSLLAENPATGAIVGTGISLISQNTYQEYAAFTDLTFHITQWFDVQLGGRESHIDQSYQETSVGPYVPVFSPGASSPLVNPKLESQANVFTYLLTPRLKISPDFMLYARLASGYRPGGPNANLGVGVPRQYDPDKTQNYEIGVKADLLDHVLAIDASLYYIDWSHIQLLLLDPQTQTTYNSNGSGAKSQGLEVTVQSRPTPGLAIAGWVAWDDAVLTQAFPVTSTVYGVPGDRLPMTSRFSANLSLEQNFPLASSMSGFVGASASYVGDREGVFRGSSMGSPLPRQNYPSYTSADLRAGVRYRSWTTNLFVNNVADQRGVRGGGLGSFPPYAFQYIQPRTVGLSFSKTF
jgi:iron complex outermembrane recepter protein